MPGKKKNKNNPNRRGKNNPRPEGTRNIPIAKVVNQSRRRRGKRNEDTVVLSGRDLVVPTPIDLPTGDPTRVTTIFQSVPANPIYWTGTRVSRIAQQYQLYRPIRFVVHYHPQVAVTNPGLVVYGTLYQEASADPSQLQQVLNTSNGGGISECYSHFTSTVDCRALQQKNFNTVGSASDTANLPFSWVATYSGYAAGAVTASASPGWVEVEWTYRFMVGNPGTGNSGLGVFTFSESQISDYNRRRALRGARNINWTAPFGVPLGVLKDAALPLLKHVSVLLLNGAQHDTFRFGVGKVLTWLVDTLSTARNGDSSLLRDDDGSRVSLADDTPVMIMMSGLPQDRPNDVDTAKVIVGLSLKSAGEWYLINQGEDREEAPLVTWMTNGPGHEYEQVAVSSINDPVEVYLRDSNNGTFKLFEVGQNAGIQLVLTTEAYRWSRSVANTRAEPLQEDLSDDYSDESDDPVNPLYRGDFDDHPRAGSDDEEQAETEMRTVSEREYQLMRSIMRRLKRAK